MGMENMSLALGLERKDASGGGTKTAAEMAAEFKAQFEKKHDAVKELAEKALAEAEKTGKTTAGLAEKADEALLGMNEMKAAWDALEQKLARGGADDASQKQSYGEQFTASEDFKGLQGAPRSGANASMSIKADITTAISGAGGVGAAVVTNRLPGVVELPRRRMTIRALLMQGRTDSPNIEYLRETAFANNAAPVAEGALKPQSDFTLTDVSTRTKVLAHWFRVTKQTLSDVSQIRSMIDTRLLYGLALKEEDQLLFGDGTAENLLGIVPQATGYVTPLAGADTQSIDRIRLMMLQASLAMYPASGIVMNEIDWGWIELLKEIGTGRYLIGNPQGVIGATLWGLPVVASQAMPADKVLVGAFDMGAQIFDQWESRIEVGFQNDDFTKNKVTILAEERLALAVYRPGAFIYGDFGRIA